MKSSSLKSPDGKRWPRQLSEKVETGILQAAFKAFSAHGFSGATTELIAKKAGISKAALYRRYKNKSAIFQAVVFENLQTVTGAFDDIELDATDIHGSLRAYALRIRAINESENYREIARLMIVEASRQPDLARAWRKSLIDQILARLVDFFKQLVDRGLMDHDYPELAARNFLVLFAGSFKPFYGVKESPNERRRVFESDLRMFMRGCGIDQPNPPHSPEA